MGELWEFARLAVKKTTRINHRMKRIFCPDLESLLRPCPLPYARLGCCNLPGCELNETLLHMKWAGSGVWGPGILVCSVPLHQFFGNLPFERHDLDFQRLRGVC